MSPFLVFLNAARNLASMGMKREQVLDFAQREFGELSELMKAQIDNIYKPKKGAPSQSKVGEFFGFKNYPKKDEVFDDTVVKMKFDDEGKPFNPRDPLKNLSKKDKDKKADGGRIGLKDSVNDKQKLGILFPMKRDGFLVSPDFDNMTEEQKMYMEGMKIQEKKRQEKLRKLLEKFKESLPENERNIKPVPMPKRELPNTGIKALASGGRVGFKKGLLASMMEGLSPDGGIFQSIFANRKHPILSTLNATELLSLGEALGPVIGFNEGGRVGLKSGTGIFKGLKKFLMPGADDKLERQLLGTELGYEGLNNLMQLLQGSGLFASGGRVGLKDGPQDPKRRSILKMIGGGLMSLPILSKLKFLAPLAPTIKKAAEKGIDIAPSYFFDLVNKIKMFGKQGKGAEDRVTEYNYKNYSLEENVSDGTQRITIKKGDPEVSYKEEVMEYTPPKMEEDIGQLPAQYDEVTLRPDMDGKMKDIEDGIDDISEILEEVKKEAPPIKKAAGGLAYMLGE